MFSLLDELHEHEVKDAIHRFCLSKDYDVNFDYWRIYWDQEGWFQANIVCPALQSILKPQEIKQWPVPQ